MTSITPGPMVYRMTLRWQLYHYGIAAVIAFPAVMLSSRLFIGLGHMIPALILFGLIGLVSLGGSVATFLYAATYTVTLEADAISARYNFSSQRMLRSEMAGYRRVGSRDGTVMLFEPKEAHGKPFRLKYGIEIDATFTDWLKGLTDLDEAERARWRAEVEADDRLGVSPADRLQTVERARVRSIGAHVAATIVIAWSWVFPLPYRVDLAALACVPLVVIAMLCFSNGVYRLDGSRFAIRPRLGLMLVVPAVMLALHAAQYKLLDWSQCWPLAVAGAALFAVLLAIANRSMGEARNKMLAYALAMATWGFGAGVVLNAQFDAEPPQAYRAMVLNKSVSKGKSPTPTISLAPWGPMAMGSRFSADRDLYDRLAEGRAACVTLHSGVLGLRWYEVGACG